MSVVTVKAGSPPVEAYPRTSTSSRKLDLFEPPLPLPKITLKAFWHERTHDDPFNRWVREHLSIPRRTVVPIRSFLVPGSLNVFDLHKVDKRPNRCRKIRTFGIVEVEARENSAEGLEDGHKVAAFQKR